jgi:hypothetical protein
MSIHTNYRFRHHRLGPDGRRYLIWASDGPGRSEEIPLGDVLAGSPSELDVVHSQLWTPNALADEGEKDILDVYFDDVAVRTNTYLRLYNDTPLETDTLATLTGEVSGTGYDGIAVARGTDWTDPALDSGDMQTASSTKTFTAGGSWTAATQLALATVQNGTAGLFLAWVALSTTRTLVLNDTLDTDLAVKLA